MSLCLYEHLDMQNTHTRSHAIIYIYICILNGEEAKRKVEEEARRRVLADPPHIHTLHKHMYACTHAHKTQEEAKRKAEEEAKRKVTSSPAPTNPHAPQTHACMSRYSYKQSDNGRVEAPCSRPEARFQKACVLSACWRLCMQNTHSRSHVIMACECT